ncbi:NAD(P)H-binding protein [Neisseria leonii]|uniref:NAD(P)H-binding protein n=1 Tax=Neisseria leonii TaxID=2995413 RepID=A0A9X4E1E5_9NEIS|nr:NAD(P)H-binding protein [Neisseria sp. 51.81]MDD9327756.1 NAD(P)H-binding protein [Neisseria sp. 51.81]
MSLPERTAILGFGYLGRALGEKLYESGCKIKAVKRRLTSDDINLPVCLTAADLNGAAALDAVLAGWHDCTAWVCLLPPSSVTDYAGLMRRVADAAGAAGVRHLVYGSSIGVYGSAARDCDENSPLMPESESAQQTAAAENALLNAAVPHIDILRLGGLYSAARHPLTALLRRQTAINGDEAACMLHQDRAVRAITAALSEPGGRRVRNLVETPLRDKRTFYRAEADKLGLPVPEFYPGGRGRRIGSRYHDFAALLHTD